VCVRAYTHMGVHLIGLGEVGCSSLVMNKQYWQILVIKNVIEELKKDKFLCFVLGIRAAYESGFCSHRNVS